MRTRFLQTWKRASFSESKQYEQGPVSKAERVRAGENMVDYKAGAVRWSSQRFWCHAKQSDLNVVDSRELLKD